MILSNTEIQKAIKAGRLIIEPMPLPLRPEIDKHCPYDTSAVDLTLSAELAIPIEEARVYSIDFSMPGQVAEFIKRNFTTALTTAEQPYQLPVGKFILGRTAEVIGLPIPPKGKKRKKMSCCAD